jgi:hypothetical protein
MDWEFIGAGIKCWNEGINVYITNPCDLWNRPHNYSPLWLQATFIPTDRAWTMPIGFAFVLAFLISLFWLVKPVNWRELIIFALACMSPMVLYCLERGNVDIIMFMMLVVAGGLSTGPLVSRILSYALILLAGLLKFYPLIVLFDGAARAAAYFRSDRRGGGPHYRRVLLSVPRRVGRSLEKYPTRVIRIRL